MNKRIVVASACIAAALAFVIGRATAGGDPEAEKAAWAALGKLGKEHADMAKCAGSWETVIKSLQDPAATPTETTGSATFRTILDGHYLVQDFSGTMDCGDGPMPYTGMGISGFDNATQRHWSIWIGSNGTGPMIAWGNKDASGKKLELKGEMSGPGGQKIPMREVLTFVDDSTHIFEMFCPGNDGKEFRCMEITYRRQKQ